jgi:hypothetical protein
VTRDIRLPSSEKSTRTMFALRTATLNVRATQPPGPRAPAALTSTRAGPREAAATSALTSGGSEPVVGVGVVAMTPGGRGLTPEPGGGGCTGGGFTGDYSGLRGSGSEDLNGRAERHQSREAGDVRVAHPHAAV